MAVPLDGGVMAVWEDAGALAVAGAAGGVDGCDEPSPPAAGGAALPPLLLGFWHPPIANPTQATAKPITMRFMRFLLKWRHMFCVVPAMPIRHNF